MGGVRATDKRCGVRERERERAKEQNYEYCALNVFICELNSLLSCHLPHAIETIIRAIYC